jgi:uncharacterized protein (TIGR03437 family)
MLNRAGATQTLPVTIQKVAPALFSMSGQGTGVAAALAVTVPQANPQAQSVAPVFQCGANGCITVPIALGTDHAIYVSFYGTGIRNRSAMSNVTATIGGVPAAVQYAGAAPQFVGLDQVNVLLPSALQGRGEMNVAITVDGAISNEVMIRVQ